VIWRAWVVGWVGWTGTGEVDRVQVNFGPGGGSHDEPGGAMILDDPEPGLLEGLDGLGLITGVDGQVEVIVGSGLLADQGVDAQPPPIQVRTPAAWRRASTSRTWSACIRSLPAGLVAG
jgi:hypothetical protein